MDGTGARLHRGVALPFIGRPLSEICMLQASTNEIFRPDPIAQPLKDILRYLAEMVRLDGSQVNGRLPSDQTGSDGAIAEAFNDLADLLHARKQLAEAEKVLAEALSSWSVARRSPL